MCKSKGRNWIIYSFIVTCEMSREMWSLALCLFGVYVGHAKVVVELFAFCKERFHKQKSVSLKVIIILLNETTS